MLRFHYQYYFCITFMFSPNMQFLMTLMKKIKGCIRSNHTNKKTLARSKICEGIKSIAHLKNLTTPSGKPIRYLVFWICIWNLHLILDHLLKIYLHMSMHLIINTNSLKYAHLKMKIHTCHNPSRLIFWWFVCLFVWDHCKDICPKT